MNVKSTPVVDSEMVHTNIPAIPTAPPFGEIDPRQVISEFEKPSENLELLKRTDFSEELEVRDFRHDPVVVRMPRCTVCGFRFGKKTFFLPQLNYKVLTCQKCGTGRLFPTPSYEEIPYFYPNDYYGEPGEKFEKRTESATRLVGSIHIKRLLRDLPQGSRVLDVGCGRGVLLEALADKGYETHGFEISKKAVQGVDPRTSVRIANDLKQAKYERHTFDAVILWHVLEHLRDPKGTLEEVREILKPGGKLIVAVPNFSSWQSKFFGPAWFHLDLPRHLFHFSANGLQELVSRCLFDCEKMDHFSLRQNPFGWLQSFLNKNPGFSRNRLYRSLKKNVSENDESYGDDGKWERFLERLSFYIGMIPALALSGIAAFMHRGGTICLTASSRVNEPFTH